MNSTQKRWLVISIFIALVAGTLNTTHMYMQRSFGDSVNESLAAVGGSVGLKPSVVSVGIPVATPRPEFAYVIKNSDNVEYVQIFFKMTSGTIPNQVITFGAQNKVIPQTSNTTTATPQSKPTVIQYKVSQVPSALANIKPETGGRRYVLAWDDGVQQSKKMYLTTAPAVISCQSGATCNFQYLDYSFKNNSIYIGKNPIPNKKAGGVTTSAPTPTPKPTPAIDNDSGSYEVPPPSDFPLSCAVVCGEIKELEQELVCVKKEYSLLESYQFKNAIGTDKEFHKKPRNEDTLYFLYIMYEVFRDMFTDVGARLDYLKDVLYAKESPKGLKEIAKGMGCKCTSKPNPNMCPASPAEKMYEQLRLQNPEAFKNYMDKK